ncbi:surface-adhesin E family protein [Pseudomonas putida]|uniref:Surface-adhesin protein E-like domain-containing protein n=1 Tax=Pseudomonas putida TaxID=303 RepID=A0A1Q9QZ22_PSEPU|nr:surface-adhesin E family protein [Pseudomonas putida]OLS60410.1 hypothetical protein PSEMO_48210 [Pseudomonas putida]
MELTRPLICLAAALLLAGCAHDAAKPETTPAAPVAPTPSSDKPAGLFEIISTSEVATFFDAHSVALYQGKPQLRQFSLINNYAKPAKIGSGETWVRSSSSLRVIDCEQGKTAQFGRVYFTEYFAKGEEVLRKDEVPRWEAVLQQSMLGQLRTMVCGLDPARLRGAGN